MKQMNIITGLSVDTVYRFLWGAVRKILYLTDLVQKLLSLRIFSYLCAHLFSYICSHLAISARI